MSGPEADQRFMRLALALGARGLGQVWPNPAVGAVIVQDGRIVGRGWTRPGGRPHAETVALAEAGPAARGATAYVSLEPCAHYGQTPPCAEALIAAGVARVVFALEDPDRRVSGRGRAMLEAAGVAVCAGVLAGEAARAHRGFLTRVRLGRPTLTLKLASSFDGRIATASGQSKWITGPDARRIVHLMRATHDAVLIGGGTARADDPMLTVRGLGVSHQPVRVVATRFIELPTDGGLPLSARDVPLWVLHASTGVHAPHLARWAALGARLIPVPVTGRQLQPLGILEALGAAGLTRVFCEGGGALAASLLNAGLVDELVGFTAGMALGAEGQPALGALGISTLDEAPRFALIEVRRVGADVMHRWERTGPAASDPLAQAGPQTLRHVD